MPEDTRSDEPQAEPAEPVPTSEPDPWSEPTWPDPTKIETRSADPPEGPDIIRRG